MQLSNILRKHAVIASVIFLLVLLVGLRFINEGLFHYDSVSLAQTLESNAQSGEFKGISAGGRYGMVLVASIVYYPFFLMGQNADFAVRLTGILMLAASAVVIYFLTFELSRSRFAAITAAMLMSVMPLFIIPSMYGKEHSTAMFFFVLACYFALRSNHSKWFAVIAPLFFVFSLTVREAYVVGAPAFLWLLFSPKIRKSHETRELAFSEHWLAALASFAIALGVILWSFLFDQLVGVANYPAASGFYFHSMHLIRGFNTLLSNAPYAWPFVLLGMYAAWKLERDALIPVVLLIAPFVYLTNLGGYSPRYLDIVVLGLVMLVGFGVQWIAARSRILATMAMFFLVLTTFWNVAPILESRHNDNLIKSFVLYLEDVTEPDAQIIAMDDAAFINYYTDREGISLDPSLDNYYDIARWMTSLQQNNTHFYVLESVFKYPQGPFIKNFIQHNFDVELAGKHMLGNYHAAEYGVAARNISIIRIKAPFFNVSKIDEYEMIRKNATDKNITADTDITELDELMRTLRLGLS